MRSGLRMPAVALAAMLVLAASSAVFAVDGASMARLKRAGVSDAVIDALVRERAIETAAFSVDDILALKAAGMGDKALQSVIASGSFMRDREAVVYGGDLKPISLSSPADLIALKKAGISDEVVQAIALVSGRGCDDDRREALEFLRNSGVWVDMRHE